MNQQLIDNHELRMSEFVERYSKAIATNLEWKVIQAKYYPGDKTGACLFYQRIIESKSGRYYPGRFTPVRLPFSFVEDVCLDIGVYTTESEVNRYVVSEIQKIERVFTESYGQALLESNAVQKRALNIASVEMTGIRQQTADSTVYNDSDRHWEMSFVGQGDLNLLVYANPQFIPSERH